eukprot:Phypoly_transcript_03219.p1 GENE.Phypoly_transcript_03219~~Phypoly_transcript_03219.p1  ORF type:complete len:546 (+),score=48.84 Phypoly_transcript_03219:883-2520(+)
MQKAELEEKKLSLGEGTYFLGESNGESTLYVRRCYVDLLKTILDQFKAQDLQRVLIVGNPGIGKSWFLFYILKVLIQHGSLCTIFQTQNGHWWAFHANGSVQYGTSQGSIPLELLEDENTWYLADTLEPVGSAKTIFVSSPCKEHYKEFQKRRNTITRFMPIWTLSELEECSGITNPQQPLSEVRRLFARWGGIARFVLEKQDDVNQALLDQAIVASNLQSIKRSVGELDTPDTNSHKVLHMVVDSTYKKYKMQLASKYVATKIFELFEENNRQEVLKFISSDSVDPRTKSLRGDLFEGYSHNQFIQGGTFKIRNLDTGEESELTLQSRNLRKFIACEDLGYLRPGMYAVPESTIFETVDSVILAPNYFFQMTVSQEHAISASGLRKLLSCVPSCKDLCFVVPPAVYPDFKKQAFNPASETFPTVTQHVLQMPLKGLPIHGPVIQLPHKPKITKQASTDLNPQIHCMAPTSKNTPCCKLKGSCPVTEHIEFRQKNAKRKAESEMTEVEYKYRHKDVDDVNDMDEENKDESDGESDGYCSEFLTED